MKLIEPNVIELSDQNPYKLVELVGRTCYKSENNITDESYISFVRGLVKRKHLAMLEHGRIAFLFDFDVNTVNKNIDSVIAKMYEEFQDLPKCYLYVNKKLSTPEANHMEILVICSLSHLYNDRWKDETKKIRVAMLDAMKSNAEYTYELIAEEVYQFDLEYEYNMTSAYNIRVITDLSEIDDVSSKFDVDELYNKLNVITLKFICDRAVSHELVRHRMALAQESQRYCGYDKYKFGGEITFIKPSEFNNYDIWPNRNVRIFKRSCRISEKLYMMLRNLNVKPELARAVLPNSTKTEVVITGTNEEWQHFLNVRYRETTGKVHPDMKKIATMAAQFLAE